MTKRWFWFSFNNGDELLVDLNTIEIKNVGKGDIITKEELFTATTTEQNDPKRTTPYWVQLSEDVCLVNLTESCYKMLLRLLIRGY